MTPARGPCIDLQPQRNLPGGRAFTCNRILSRRGASSFWGGRTALKRLGSHCSVRAGVAATLGSSRFVFNLSVLITRCSHAAHMRCFFITAPFRMFQFHALRLTDDATLTPTWGEAPLCNCLQGIRYASCCVLECILASSCCWCQPVQPLACARSIIPPSIGFDVPGFSPV